MLRFLVFDLDETLYPAGSGMFEAIKQRIHLYLAQRLGLPYVQIARLRKHYLERYGTTLRGLQIHHGVDPEDYLAFVHNVDVSTYLHPDPILDAALSALSQEKVIFTNATTEHATRVLQVLGIAQHFQRIFDIRSVHFQCKPDPEAYRILLEALPASGPECLLIEDNPSNLRAGKAAGMYTVLIGSEIGPEDSADYCVADIRQIGDIVRALSER